jgi:hypothetical protein
MYTRLPKGLDRQRLLTAAAIEPMRVIDKRSADQVTIRWL